MPQKIDVHGLFIDPETITDLLLQKRVSVYYPVFYEVSGTKSWFRRSASPQHHILQFDHQEPYGIILADVEQPDTASYAVTYREALVDKVFKGVSRTGKNIAGHVAELLKIEISGDRQYRILQSGRNVKTISIREIPAKARLLSGQWVDVFKSSQDYDFQGGTPYAVTDVGASALMITTKNKSFVLFGAGIDATNEEVVSAYHSLAEIYNEIQARHDSLIAKRTQIPRFSKLQKTVQLPKVELPKIDLQQIRTKSPFVLDHEKEKATQKRLQGPNSATDSTNKPDN